MKLEEWVDRHSLEGHHPHPVPTHDNPEKWECDCGTIWRILTIEQMRQKYAHLTNRPTPDHIADPRKYLRLREEKRREAEKRGFDQHD